MKSINNYENNWYMRISAWTHSGGALTAASVEAGRSELTVGCGIHRTGQTSRRIVTKRFRIWGLLMMEVGGFYVVIVRINNDISLDLLGNSFCVMRRDVVER